MTLLAQNVVPMLNRGWASDEINAIEGYIEHLKRIVSPARDFDIVYGVSDEGDPWAVVSRKDATIVYTFARERADNEAFYIVTAPGLDGPVVTPNLSDYLAARVGYSAATRLGILKPASRKPLVPMWARQVLISLLVVVGMDAVEVGMHRQMNTVHAALLMLGLL